MENRELAKIFYVIADFLEADKVDFKPFAYRKAAIALETMEEDAAAVYAAGGLKALEEIPGVGKSIAEKIEEFLKTGKIKYYQDLKRKLPVNLEEIIAIEGMGPKRAKILYQKLGTATLADVEKAAKAHKIAPLFGFGEKTEKNILEGIKFLKRSKGRFLLGDILPRAREINAELQKLEEIEKIEIAGSLRRMKETIGDIDFLAILKPSADKVEAARRVMDFFAAFPGVVKVWGKGTTKASVRLKEGFDMDIRVLPKQSYGAALQYFTGSKEHNVAMRRIAIDRGLKLSEYGLFRSGKMIGGADEEEIYRLLGLCWVPPEMREDQGEIEAAKNGRFPKIIGYGDILGDLHCHSNWNGGSDTIEELAEAAKARGHQYIGIADHTKFLKIEHGLDEAALEKRNRHIDKLNKRFEAQGSVFKILKGCEANIMPDGSIDVSDESLKKLDYAIAGVHSNMKMDKAAMTARIVKAMRNPNVDIISHPTGRLLKRRDEYLVDLEKVLRVASETDTILEINSYPRRLDLNDFNIRLAKNAGVKMAINTDAHRADQLRFIDYGIAQARRGWAEKKDIVNAHPLEKLMVYFKKV
jgi:DNA polymerase (family 10)